MPNHLLLAKWLYKFIESIKAWDTWLFLKVNTQWTNTFMDSVFPWWRDGATWVPLYLFLLLFMLMNFGNKAWIWIAFTIITITLTDQVSSSLLKNLIARPRPCADEHLWMHVRMLLGHCSGEFSFPSSHATNHFGITTFWVITLKEILGKWRWLFWCWAITVSYGQIYVGVHYPVDVLSGALLGMLLGWVMASLYLKGNKRFHLPQTHSTVA
ncbi:MAG: phosphatase PAP2 family protein [Bacteroidota bacterium]|nr:phosphatase PAP2 family protein [Bacteroidota bacterium]